MKKLLLILFIFTITTTAAQRYIMLTGIKSNNDKCCTIPVLLDTDDYSDEILKEYFEELAGIYNEDSIKIYKSKSLSEVKRLGEYSKFYNKFRISKSKLRKFKQMKK